jgi:hypothetical protein
MTRAPLGAGLALALLAPAAASAGNVPAPTTPFDLRGAATYSAICVHDETGDVVGVRVFVRSPSARPRVVVQTAEGDLGLPVAARSWTEGGRLYFAAPKTAATPELAGEIGKRTARLTIPYGDFRTLPLRNDRRGFPICD